MMRILKIHPKKPEISLLKQAVAVFKSGGIVVYPTETAYGLGADATNLAAIEKIFQMKERDRNKSLTLIAASENMVKKYLVWNDRAAHIAAAHWPGAVTLVMPKKNTLPKTLSKDHTVGMRVSSHPVAHALSLLLKKPIIATSANFSGDPNAYSSKRIEADFSTARYKPDLILDAGVLPRRKPSTILRVTKTGVELLRAGTVRVKFE